MLAPLVIGSLYLPLLAADGAVPEGGAGAACAEAYDAEATFLANPDETPILAAVAGWSRAEKQRLTWDARYARVARAWSQHLLQSQAEADRLLPLERLRFELRSAGVSDERIMPYSVSGEPEGVPPEVLQFLKQEAPRGGFTHFGVGAWRTPDQKRTLVTLLLGRRPAFLDPVPMCPAPGARLPLRARLLRGFNHPRWLLLTPQGNVLSDSLQYEEGAWHGEVPLDNGRGLYRLEITVQGQRGLEVAALVPLFVGVERPRLPTVKAYPGPARFATPEDAARLLLELLNGARERASLPPLKPVPLLDRVASEHSDRLLIDRHAVHRTPGGGTLFDRLRAARHPFVRALECVSLARSPQAAHDRFMESPGHRLNLLDPAIAQVGIGVAMERGPEDDILAVTEIFVEPPDAEDTAAMAQKLHEMINQRRRAQGRFALGLDAALSRLALQSARRLSQLGSRADPEAERALLAESLQGDEEEPAAGETGAARVESFSARSLKAALSAKNLLAEDINRVGIGIARIAGEGERFWIVLVFAGR